jgi:hypothetical protein
MSHSAEPGSASDGDGVPGAALRRSRPLTPEALADLRLRRQWVITRRSDEIEHPWPRIDLDADFVLHHHPEARVQAGRMGDAGALTIGVAVSTSATAQDLDRQLAALGTADQDRVNRFLYDLCGTYVLLRYRPGEVTLYTDPAGLMTVYRGNGRVASSPSLLGVLQRDAALDREFAFGPDNDWYPGTLTPFVGVVALPANHALDLATGGTRRTWPHPPIAAISSEEGTQRIASLLRTLAGRVLERGPVICSLTGGKDSRVNLAAIGDRHEEVEFFTIRADGIKTCDLEIPVILARRFGLEHTVVEAGPPPRWLLGLYDEIAAGLAIGGRRSIAEASSRIAGTDYIHLNGNLGGVTKSYFWHTRHPRRLRRRSLSKEFAHTSPRIDDALDGWLDTLPDLPPTTIYNLMYLEQRAGRWAGVGEMASNLFYDSVTLLASREIIDTICALPVDAQYGGRTPVDLVRRLWPELLDVPYCAVRRNWSTYVPRRVKTRLKAMTGHT